MASLTPQPPVCYAYIVLYTYDLNHLSRVTALHIVHHGLSTRRGLKVKSFLVIEDLTPHAGGLQEG